MDKEFRKPRSYKSLSSSETISEISLQKFQANESSDQNNSQDFYVQLVESFQNLLKEINLL